MAIDVPVNPVWPNARDDNDDALAYAVYYKGDNETRWKLLKDRLTDKFYYFESDLLPDGGYTVRVTATDAPSHTPEEALTDEHESSRFEVDNTRHKSLISRRRTTSTRFT